MLLPSGPGKLISLEEISGSDVTISEVNCALVSFRSRMMNSWVISPVSGNVFIICPNSGSNGGLNIGDILRVKSRNCKLRRLVQ